MVSLVRTDATNPEFNKLVRELDKELAVRDGDDHAFYDQYNKLDAIGHVVVAFLDGDACGCGAIKALTEDAMEVKRMFVPFAMRKRGIASAILGELEKWAKELGYKSCILETGEKQPEAVILYKKQGYKTIPNYGQYMGVRTSICFKKLL